MYVCSSSSPPPHHGLKELELYKEELVSKPALLVVNKMDLPDAADKLAELKDQLQNPDGEFEFGGGVTVYSLTL